MNTINKTPSILLLKKQNFVLLRILSLFLYIILLSIIPITCFFITCAIDEKLSLAIPAFSILIIYLFIHEFILFNIHKFVINNFELYEDFTFYIKGAAFSFPLLVICIGLYGYIKFTNNETTSNFDFFIFLVSFIVCSGCVFSIVKLYDEIRYSTNDFVDELTMFFNDNYSMPAKFILMPYIVIEKIFVFFRLPTYLNRLFREAKLYSDTYGFAD